ncbi:MAG: GNAT family N-acetyltransferase [Chitinophagaceae bacterium]|jgi:RimJ/RimL family protein N-acetyltransferase|nr:GNAT family N-acetyltransferase [Chitinophagaceae bacterium]
MSESRLIPVNYTLRQDQVILRPLYPEDLDVLYSAASDPLIWVQHPNPDRYRREVFEVFFEGAIASQGAFLILDASNGEVIGSSRFYDHNPEAREVKIGYTFFARRCWGQGFNTIAKQLMTEHAFQWVDRIIFQIGAGNLRSQIAIGRIGAHKIGEEDVAYFGELPKRNFIYALDRKM